MRKAISIFLLCLLATSSSLSVSGQKRSADRLAKTGSLTGETRFGSVKAYSDGNGVLISWQMEAEKDNYGFFVYRIDTDGERLVSSHKVIEGSAMRVGKLALPGQSYSYFDADGTPGAGYIVRTSESGGRRTSSSFVTAVPVTDLKSVAGNTSNEMRATVEAANWDLERSELVVSKKLRKEMDLTIPVPNPVMHDHVVTQPGVRISVKRSGLYRIPKAQLEAAGFNTSLPSVNWQLYADGVEQAMLVGPNDEHIEFIGRGVSTNESDTRVYYLTNGNAPGKRMVSLMADPEIGIIAPSYEQILVKEERSTFNDNVINGPAENYWGRAIANWMQSDVPFNAKGVDLNSPEAVVNVKVQGISQGAHIVEVRLNNQLIGTLTGSGTQSMSNDFVVPTSLLVEGNNTLRLQAMASAEDFALFDAVRVAYFRNYKAVNGQLSFFTYLQKAAVVEGFPSANVRIFETTYDGSPMTLSGVSAEPSNGAFRVVIPAGRSRQFLAVDDSAILSPVSVTSNDPSSLKNPSLGANLVIISYRDFIDQSETWANYRRAQGVTVKVVEVSEVFDEFNYGVSGAAAIKSFLQYASLNWQTPPQYVLLMGDGSYDPRNYEGRGAHNYVPTAFVNTIFTETASDEALADFNNDGLADMAIGRIPARNVETINIMFNKMVAWENSLSDPLARGALFASDLPDAGWNFQNMSIRLGNRLPEGTPKSFVHRGDANATSTLISQINSGKYIVNYAGHGSSGSWANNFLNVTHVPQFTNANNQSLFTMLTCLNGYFHGIWNDSFAEVMTRAPNGGAVAAWASTGLTTPDVQEVLATRFYEQIGVGSIPRLGDLIRDAKNTLNGGQDVRLSWVLIGDPMMKVR